MVTKIRIKRKLAYFFTLMTAKSTKKSICESLFYM